jgi:hypothetical protein
MAEADNIGSIDSAIDSLNNPVSLCFLCQKAKHHHKMGSITAPAIAIRITSATGAADAINFPWILQQSLG